MGILMLVVCTDAVGTLAISIPGCIKDLPTTYPEAVPVEDIAICRVWGYWRIASRRRTDEAGVVPKLQICVIQAYWRPVAQHLF